MQLIIFYVILLIEIAIKSKRKTEVTIMEFKSILIKDTTVEERKQIVKEVLGEEWLTNELFRLGTSRLANLLLSEIVGQETKFF